jgi:2,3-bisphosphoglycerate-independent phosphoglycerate mutase
MDWTLERRTGAVTPAGPVIVVVMDGVGVGRGDEGDAVALARTPVLDGLRQRFPWRTLRAHGTAVGLPDDGDMGNSEVGHNALGAGRVFDQGAKLVNRALSEGLLFRGEAWLTLERNCLEHDTPMHFIGLLSDGNVHSHIDHLEAMITRAAEAGIRRVFVHALLDGRDVPETSALLYLERIEACLARFNGSDGRTYQVASGGGRMVTTMDRYEADWRIVERGWKAHVHGEGRRFRSAREAVETFRAEDPKAIDQFLPPFVIQGADGAPLAPIGDGASVIFFNFRGDRGIEISRAFEQDEFPYFDRGARPRVCYAGMMQYDGDYHIPRAFLVAPPALDRTLGEYLARNGVPQFACSETQKYGHVTYFWNGNRGGKFDETSETYLEITSDRVPFEQRPWMKAAEITDATAEALRSGQHRFLRINYANGDMVGHTGVREAAIVGVETVDLSLGRLLSVVESLHGVALVTADHGNADEMYERDKGGAIALDKVTGLPQAKTSHSLNPVPFVMADFSAPEARSLREDLPRAGLANVAATVLQILGYNAPEGYEPSLLR